MRNPLRGSSSKAGVHGTATAHGGQSMNADELLSQVRVPHPCEVPWSDMAGDERVRFCRQCGRHVYNLRQMTAEDGARLIAQRGDDLCVQLARRHDGTVLTSDAKAPDGWRPRFARWVRLLAP